MLSCRIICWIPWDFHSQNQWILTVQSVYVYHCIVYCNACPINLAQPRVLLGRQAEVNRIAIDMKWWEVVKSSVIVHVINTNIELRLHVEYWWLNDIPKNCLPLPRIYDTFNMPTMAPSGSRHWIWRVAIDRLSCKKWQGEDHTDFRAVCSYIRRPSSLQDWCNPSS